MMIRAAIRYSEYKSAGKLPQNIEFKCDECIEKDLKEKRNCGGFDENSKYKLQIGTMEFYQCPISIPDEETWTLIELIMASEETGIPITGTCLLDQTRAFFEYRRIVNNEKYECHKEIHKLNESDNKRNQNKEAHIPQLRSRKPQPKKK
jgi:hypothetical protein